MTYENLWMPPLLSGQTIAQVGDRYDGDVLGDDPVAAATEAVRTALTAVASVLPGEGTVDTSTGDLSMEAYVTQLAFENLIHGWDLLAGIGGERRLDPGLVAEAGRRFDEFEQAYRSSNSIGPRLPLTGEPQADLLARFGRDHAWSGPSR